MCKWVGGGDLQELLNDSDRLATVTVQQRVAMFKGMVCGLSVLHHGYWDPIR